MATTRTLDQMLPWGSQHKKKILKHLLAPFSELKWQQKSVICPFGKIAGYKLSKQNKHFM